MQAATDETDTVVDVVYGKAMRWKFMRCVMECMIQDTVGAA
eukprot:IDg4359t1